ncbi:ubiquitin-like-specific protease ESD4 [Capsicum galapagoense]
MGGLTSNKKRGNNLFSSNFDPHIPKKLKISVLNSSVVPSKSSTVHKFFKYPDPINQIRREIHAPCRNSRFGYKQLKGKLGYSAQEMGNSISNKYKESKSSDLDSLRFGYKGNLDSSAHEMGNSISNKYEESKRSDLDSYRSLKKDIVGNSEYSAREMGNSMSRKREEAKRSDFDSLKKDIEVINVVDDDDKEVWFEDSSMEELEVWGCEKSDLSSKSLMEVDGDVKILDGYDGKSTEEVEAWGGGKSDLLGKNLMEVDGDVKILDDYDGKDSSVVTGLDDGNLKEESVGKMIESLDMNPTSDSYFYVPLYKKLLGSVEKISHKLKRIHFQIGLNEKCLETNRLLRPQKKGEKFKEDVIPEPFVPLTEEEQDEVSRALSKSCRRKVLVSHKNSNIEITGEILQCLRPGQWLNDEVVNLYLELLKEREKREPEKFLKCHFFSTFFYNKLISGREGYNYQSVRRWTSQRKLGYCLLDCDKIFVPIHKEIHWCLAVINKRDKKFQYLDSLKGRDVNVLKVLARYFVDEVKDKSGKSIDVSSWKQEFVEDLPEQKNGYDCGVFMIKNADFYSRDIGLCFNQGDMPYFRKRTAKELLRLKAD